VSDRPSETIGAEGGTLFSTTKPGTDVGITPNHTHTHRLIYMYMIHARRS